MLLWNRLSSCMCNHWFDRCKWHCSNTSCLHSRWYLKPPKQQMNQQSKHSIWRTNPKISNYDWRNNSASEPVLVHTYFTICSCETGWTAACITIDMIDTCCIVLTRVIHTIIDVCLTKSKKKVLSLHHVYQTF